MKTLLFLYHHQIWKGVSLQVIFSREPRIKANYLFGSHVTCRTSFPERASADWWLSQYEGDEFVTMIQRKALSDGKEDEAEECKILGWKDEIIKSRVDWLTWLNHVQCVICRSHDLNIIIFFSLRHKLRWSYRCRYEYSLVQNLSTHWETREENQETNKNILAL